MIASFRNEVKEFLCGRAVANIDFMSNNFPDIGFAFPDPKKFP